MEEIYGKTRILCTKCKKRGQKFLGDESMELIGWRKINNNWICPFCTGNLDTLFKIFNKKR